MSSYVTASEAQAVQLTECVVMDSKESAKLRTTGGHGERQENLRVEPASQESQRTVFGEVTGQRVKGGGGLDAISPPFLYVMGAPARSTAHPSHLQASILPPPPERNGPQHRWLVPPAC